MNERKKSLCKSIKTYILYTNKAVIVDKITPSWYTEITKQLRAAMRGRTETKWHLFNFTFSAKRSECRPRLTL